MKPSRKQLLPVILTLIGLLSLFFALPQTVDAQSGTPDEMHEAINTLRAANGLSPLSVNSYLMQAAQNHANWIAAGNPGGHTGANGSTAYDRALAVGYGQGAQIWVTENWARGFNLTVSDCIYSMWNDAAHMNNMLTTWHNEFSAGVALDQKGMTVYVVNFGHSSGTVIPTQPTITPGGPTLTPDLSTSTPSAPTNTPEPLIQPVLTATPNPDGSVIHVVQTGQSLWAVADGYNISLADLLALNNLTEESAIYVGQQLMIFPASIEVEETEEVLAVEAVEPTAAPSVTPTSTQTATALPTNADTPTEEVQQASASFLSNIFSGDTLWVGIGLVGVTVFGIGLLLFTSARLK